MSETKMFLMPDYFPSFSCKMGACRTVCCSGWQVSISLDNYFALIGTDCSMELRRKMDCALKPVDYPDEGKYATIHPNYLGECPLRLEDGRCGVQAELGEDILPDICRLYPRGVRRHGDGYEISLAGSCEAVPELFLHRKEPITFEMRPLALKLPPVPASQLGDWHIRKERINTMQDRNYTLRQRLARLGGVEPGEVDADTLSALLQVLVALAEHSESVRCCATNAVSYFEEDPLLRYQDANEKFMAETPDWEAFFEHLLVNHMFFTRYPYSEKGVPETDRFAALTLVYAVLRLLALASAANAGTDEDLTDAISAALRLIEHTDFDKTALYLLKKYALYDKISALVAV